MTEVQGSPPKETPEKQESQFARWKAAAKLAVERWEAAGPAKASHPYLVKKGLPPDAILRDTEIRQDGNVLVIPMYALKRISAGYQIKSLQSIHPDGTKLFLKDGKTTETRVTLGLEYLRWGKDGKPLDGQTIYVCEGWATGWTIAHIMKAPVAVAFSNNNLKAVATHIKAHYVNLTLVVAADNDRWGKDAITLKPYNAGVDHARKAIGPAFGTFVIPDFKPEHLVLQPGQKKGPTDFNDLWRLEGEAAVRYWLDPKHRSEANTTVIAPPAAPQPNGQTPHGMDEIAVQPEPEPEPKGWRATMRFRLLGFDRGTYFYLPRSGGQIVDLTPENHERVAQLCRLETKAWWETHFPGKGGVDTKGAADALMQASHAVGIYRPDNVRGRGCWREDDEELEGEAAKEPIVLHLGDRMAVPGATKYIEPEQYESPGGYMYERQAHCRGPAKVAMTMSQAEELLDISRSLMWQDDTAGDLLAGWTMLAPIGGALPWRPHVFMTGERGCGKSTIVESYVVPLLTGPAGTGGMALQVLGETSGPGIRQRLMSDAFPVVFDEAEESEGVGHRIQGVIALARASSSETGAVTLKGTTYGESLEFRVRSMFCLAAIGGAIYQEADKSRVSMLRLMGDSQVDPVKKRNHWDELGPRILAITPDTGRALLTRTLWLLRSGVLLDTVKVFRRVGGRVYKDQRTGDQYGTLYAGAWLMQCNDSPSESDAREMMATGDLMAHQEGQIPEGKKALQIILQQLHRVDTEHGPKTLAVGQLLEICASATDGAFVKQKEAEFALAQMGLRLEANAIGHSLLVAVQSTWIEEALEGTFYQRNMTNVVQTLEGVELTEKTVRFHKGLACRALKIPYHTLSE